MKLLPVFIPHRGCPNQCIYCDQNAFSSVSPTHSEMDPASFKADIERFIRFNPVIPKEIAFYGGTFSALPHDEIERLLTIIEPYLPGLSGIRFSTRPDMLDREFISYVKSRGVTTIELGVQSFDDGVLLSARRGYCSIEAIETCKLVKAHGINLCIQLLPGLPDDTPDTWNRTIEQAIALQPRYSRIYPCIVLKGTQLEKSYRDGEYTPLSIESAIQWSADAFQRFTESSISVIKIGLHGDVDPNSVVAGPWHPSFGELVRAEVYLRQFPAELTGTLCVAPQDVSMLLGYNRMNLHLLKAKWNVERIPILIDKSLPKGIIDVRKILSKSFW